ncbi:hypothetical protein GCM10027613_31600 [Microlunatus endophyticus]
MNKGFQTGAPDPAAARIPPLPDWALDRVHDLTATRIATMRQAGVVIHGDPATLQPPGSYRTSAEAVALDEPTMISITTMVDGLMTMVEAAESAKSPAARTAPSNTPQPPSWPPNWSSEVSVDCGDRCSYAGNDLRRRHHTDDRPIEIADSKTLVPIRVPIPDPSDRSRPTMIGRRRCLLPASSPTA